MRACSTAVVAVRWPTLDNKVPHIHQHLFHTILMNIFCGSNPKPYIESLDPIIPPQSRLGEKPPRTQSAGLPAAMMAMRKPGDEDGSWGLSCLGRGVLD